MAISRSRMKKSLGVDVLQFGLIIGSLRRAEIGPFGTDGRLPRYSLETLT